MLTHYHITRLTLVPAWLQHHLRGIPETEQDHHPPQIKAAFSTFPGGPPPQFNPLSLPVPQRNSLRLRDPPLGLPTSSLLSGALMRDPRQLGKPGESLHCSRQAGEQNENLYPTQQPPRTPKTHSRAFSACMKTGVPGGWSIK